MSKSVKQDIFAALIFTILFGLLGYMLGTNRFAFDTLNYHLYAPHAFLNGKIGTDIMPAGIRSYFNPIADIPFYFMVRYLNNYGGLISILLALNTSLFAFVVYKINKLFLRKNFWINIVAVLFSVTGSSYIIEVASTHCDYISATFILLGVYYALKGVNSDKKINYVISGLMTGTGVGLKIASAPMAIGLFLTLIVVKRGWKNTLAFCTGGFVSWFFVGGIWHIYIWYKFKNPLFPFFNDIFKSPYYPPSNIYDSDYNKIKTGIPYVLKLFLYPFTLLFNVQGLYRSDYEFIDIRPLVQCLSMVGYAFSKKKSNRLTTLMWWLALSYALWLFMFTDLRYALPIWAFSGLFLVLCFKKFKKYTKRLLLPVITSFFVIVLCLTKYPSIRDFQKINFREKLYNYKEYKIPDNSVVFVCSQACTLPVVWLNNKAKYVQLVIPQNYPLTEHFWAYEDVDYSKSPYYEEIIKEELKNKDKDFYMLFLYGVAKSEDKMVKEIIHDYNQDFSIDNMYSDCKSIVDDAMFQGYVLCKLKRSINKEDE